MTRAALLLVLGMAAAAFALPQPESSFVYTGPMFNPTEALSYGPSETSSVPIKTPSAHSSVHTSAHSSKSSVAKTSHTIVSSSSSAPRSSTPVPSSTTQSETPSTAQSIAQVSGTGAAHANYPEYLGALAGGLIAGMALV